MAKLIFMILASFSISTDVLYGGEICNNYNDKGCVHPDTLKNGYYENKWSVHLPGMPKEEAQQLLKDKGFNYIKQVMPIMGNNDLHLVTKDDTIEKHVNSNDEVIEFLKKIEKVKSVNQKHVLQNSPNNDVSSMYKENRVEYEAIDPDTIILDDGRQNFERIKTDKMDLTSNARPTSSTNGANKVNTYLPETSNINTLEEQLKHGNLMNINFSELESFNELDDDLLDDANTDGYNNVLYDSISRG